MGSQTAPQSGAALTDAVTAVVAPAVASLGADLEGVQIRNAGARLLLRIMVDVDGGVTLDRVAEISVAVSAALDGDPVLGERSYVLDVGSPGVDRPLTLLRHWRRNNGRLVKITGVDGSVHTGRIAAAEGPAADAPPEQVTLEVNESQQVMPAGLIKRAVVQIEFLDAGGDD